MFHAVVFITIADAHPNINGASQPEFAKNVLMPNAFSESNGILSLRILATLLLRIGFIVRRSI